MTFGQHVSWAHGASVNRNTEIGTDHPRFARAVAVFIVFLAIFALSPVRQFSDAAYSLLVSEVLLRDGSFALDAVIERPLDPTRHPASARGELPYHLREHRGHLYYQYPPGTSILSVPFVAVSHLFGMSALFPDGSYNYREERRMQLRLAALLMACFVVVVDRMATRLLPAPWGLTVTVAAALATQVWSTASRGLWSHTWAILLVVLAVDHLLRVETGSGRLRPIVLATVLCWAYFTRPTMAIGVVGVGIYLALRHRHSIAAYGATVIGWLALFVTMSWTLYGTLLPPYYRPGKLGTAEFWTGLAGNLVSPSRGLLVFLPFLPVIGYWLVRYRRQSALMPLAALGCLAATAHLLVIASFPIWWGGDGYGPRLMTDAVPWLVLVSLVAVQGRLAAEHRAGPRRSGRFRVETCVAGALVAAAVFVHAVGALSHATNEWNWTPIRVDEAPERVWNWRDPQFLAPFHARPGRGSVADVTDEKHLGGGATSDRAPA